MRMIKGAYEPVKLEEKVASWWSANNIFKKVVESKIGKEPFNFLEGPPTTNGFMHVGHARGRTMKDVILRFKTMQGYDVWRQAGWDCQGLPVELEVEKKLGTKTKKDLEELGLENFVQNCKDLVDYYIKHWRSTSERLGLWLDYENAYETRKEKYIEFVWWTLKKADEKGLLTEDFKVIPTCPRCETSLSSHEVALGYTTVIDPSIYVKFPLENKKNEYVIIWTTTPWTIPGDEAVCVHPNFEYVRVQVGNEIWIMARKLVENVMKAKGIAEYKIVETVPGKKLKGLRYIHPLLKEVPKQEEHRGKFDHTIICAEHVTLEEGTGCVHTAPAHGPEDFEIGKRYDLPIFCPVDITGHFTEDGGKYAGKYVKDADHEIIEDLKRKGLMLLAKTIEHEYPLCWRCDSPLIYRTDKQWFLKIDPIKDIILKENAEVDWVPEWAGTSRFQDWLINAQDWCISRSRIWGSPLNVWICEKCGSKHVIGTIKELKTSAKIMPEHFELHRPWVDQIILKCQRCGGDMKRVVYVLDCWLDSGVAHAASIGYLEDKSLFKKLFPYDFITEAIDQTRGWFYSLIFTGVIDFNRSPYRRVLCQGHILDKYGQKMSKSRGNVIWAAEAIDKTGADPLRLYLLWKASPWDALAFDYDEVEQVKRWLAILWNVFAFATTYMDLDEFDPENWTIEKLKDHLRPEDRWLLSRTQSLVKDVTENLETIYLHQSVRDILNFITENLSRLYVRLIRRRTWVERYDPDKLAAYATLYESLSTLLKLLAPFVPYISEELYQHLVRSINPHAPKSIHMCSWPKPVEEWVDKKLEDEMSIVEGLISIVLHLRQKARLKLRWPIREICIVPCNEGVAEASKNLEKVLLNQTNAKNLLVLKPGEIPRGAKIVVKPNYSILGPRYRKRIREMTKILQKTSGELIMKKLSEVGNYAFKLGDGTPVELKTDEVCLEEVLPDNLVSATSTYGKIYIDTTRTPELLSEALAKEIVRRVQIMRKEMDLRVEEFIDLVVKVGEKETIELLKTRRDYIATEVRAGKLQLLGPGETMEFKAKAYNKDWNIEGESVRMAITRLE